MPDNPTYHTPVLLCESVDGLNVREGGIYVDATFGGGGHSREILRRLGGSGHLYAFDQDGDALEHFRRERGDEATDSASFTFIHSNFRYLRNFLRYHGVTAVDGILADLGVSSHHFDDPARGFTFRHDAPLDMRMNQCARLTAADILNTYDEAALASVLHLYGELRQSRRLAADIVRTRERQPYATAADLLRLLPAFEADGTRAPSPAAREAKKDAARLFQALRIEVNHEMDALTALLTQAVAALRPGGRLAVIAYHSLEDRLVKNVMRTGRCDGVAEQDPVYGGTTAPLRPLRSGVITPTQDEQDRNPRSRSARLRVAEKL